MPVHLVFTCFGAFFLDESSKIIAEHLIYPSVELAAIETHAIAEGESTDWLGDVAKEIGSLNADVLIVEDASLNKAISRLTDVQVTTDSISNVIKWFRNSLDASLLETGKVESANRVRSFRRDVAIQVARQAIISASEEKDLIIKHAIDAIGETDKSINVLAMRLREWYSLHHPSLDKLVENHEIYANIVKACGSRKTLTLECLETTGLSKEQAQLIIEQLKKDLGAPFEEKDLVAARSLASSILNLYQFRRELEGYVTEMMQLVAPNVTSLVGALVGARLLSLAGSLEELARKPSSTVQIFGAEKALFRSLKTGADPPKHGIIYQVAEVHSAPYWQRGKIARALAGRLSIAARIDAYTKRDVGESLRKKFLERVEEIKKQHPEAPPPKPPTKASKPPKRKKGQRRQGGHKRKEGGGK
ncbi:MAG: C/D box methylation guide ribonucleoprotein complex aNOP56 subunit [Promethearchaeota archaeon]